MAGRRSSYYNWDAFSFRPYVPVAQRRRQAAQLAARARQRGEPFDPVLIAGREIATTPWGRAWCDHIEGFSDYANRLPRGRTYVRNGSVLHLEIRPGEIRSQVMGSDLYEQRIEIAPCRPAVWKRVRRRCAGSIGSLIELLEGRIAAEVMAAMTAERDGLLPDLEHVRMACSCPDWAGLCKHLAAVLYGVGARLDARPELLFALRGVDPADLVDGAARPGRRTKGPAGTPTVDGDLASVFGIELEEDPPSPSRPRPGARRAGRRSRPPAAPSAPEQGASSPPRSRTARQPKVRRQELLERGVPPGTISTWLHQGILRASDERGVYLHTRASRSRLAQYGR
ncbi:MAG: hypothetical protein AB1726_00515 [Planctomycetota bacterium]